MPPRKSGWRVYVGGDGILTRKMQGRAGPGYTPVSLETLVQGVESLLRAELGEVSFTHDDQFKHKTIEASLTDKAGRNVSLKGSFYAHFPLIPCPEVTLYESSMSCEIDGKPGVGWAEFMWPTQYLGYLSSKKG